MSATINQIDQYLDHSHARAVQSLFDVLRIPSISTQPDHARDVAKAAQWVADYLKQAGLAVEIWPTAGHPCVYGEWLGAGSSAPTLLIYGHHDVQPTGDLSKWTHPPFEPHVDTAGRIVARGSADNKGLFFLQILAAEA